MSIKALGRFLRFLFFVQRYEVVRFISAFKNGENFSWDCDDPQLYIAPKHISWLGLSDFYMLEVSYFGRPNSLATLYFDVGNGFNEQNTFHIPLKASGGVKRICYFPQPVKRLRFDPADEPGSINNLSIRFVKLTRRFAHKKMREKISRAAPRFQVTSPVDGYDLLARYNKVFDTVAEDYPAWMTRCESVIWQPVLPEQALLISVVVPVYNTPALFLRTCINSVLEQTYTNWQLILCDDASTLPETRALLHSFAGRDARIKIVWRTENGHISAATNTALKHATGDYVAFLDHDDMLSPHALNEVACYLAYNPNTKILYTDEDKISELGVRFAPYFKPDFNRELLLAHNYISHFSVIRSDLVRDVGGLRKGYEGSQDYDLILRCMACCNPLEIGHVDKILYHWRAIEGSTALSANTKNYSQQAGLLALQDYMRNQQLDWQVFDGPVPNSYRVYRPLINTPLVSILIPTRDRVDLLRQCINSVRSKTCYQHYEIIVVDNDSCEAASHAYFSELATFDNVKVVPYHHDFNYSAINNYAVQRAAVGEYVLLLNNDIEVITPAWLDEMLAYALLPNAGCIGAKLYYPDMSIQHAGVTLGIGGVAGHTHKYFPQKSFGYFSQLVLPRQVSAVTAACLLVKKSIFLEVGGLDELNLKVAFNDVDFCIKVSEAGYANYWTPYAELIHHESVSRGHENTPEKQQRFQSEVLFMRTKWGSSLDKDPFYNTRLSLEHEDFSLRF